ncbi:MAG: iron-containing alcohol dehydrogenase, partial [Clostridiales bacterium]
LGFVDKIIDILNEKTNKNTVVFSDVMPDPDIKMITQGMNEMDKLEIDTVIAVGGGSVIDAAKAIMYCLNKLKKSKGQDYQKPKFIAIPSTSGTGSEVTPFAVITDEKSSVKYLCDSKILQKPRQQKLVLH